METRLRQLFRGEGTSPNLIDVLPKRLKIDPLFELRYHRQPSRTLFEEATRIPFEEAVPEGLRQLALIPGGSGKSGSDLYKQLGNVLLWVIEDCWRPEGMHVVLHSSGIDSRLISWALRVLHDQKDLGQLLFLCTKDEGPAFRQIMEYEGWAPSQYYVVDETVTSTHRWARELLSFENFWEQHAGSSVLPFNALWYLIAGAQQEGVLSSRAQIQVWSGLWANELMELGSENILQVAERLYACPMATVPFRGTEVVLPLIDFRLLSALLASLEGFSRLGWLEYLDPQLAAFVSMGGIRKNPPKINSKILNCAQAVYDCSWYGRHVAPGIELPNVPLRSPSWGHFSAASFVSHLIRIGHEVDV